MGNFDDEIDQVSQALYDSVQDDLVDNREWRCEHCGSEIENCVCEEQELEDNADELEYVDEYGYHEQTYYDMEF